MKDETAPTWSNCIFLHSQKKGNNDEKDSFFSENLAVSNDSRFDEGGFSPICFAAVGGNASLLSALLARKCSPNEQTLRHGLEWWVYGMCHGGLPSGSGFILY